MSDLSVQIESLSPVVRRLKIDVPADRVGKVADSVYRRLGQTVKLRGFRQGHVPRRVLEKHFADQVRSDVARELMQTTFREVLGTTELTPVSEPTVEPEDLKFGEVFRYSARVEVRPEVKLVQYKGLEASIPSQKVEEADVDRRLNELREAAAVLAPVEGRDAADWGDSAIVDWSIELPGRKPEKRDQGMIVVEPGSFTSGHGEKLHGLKIGEPLEFKETIGQRGEEVDGKEATIKVKITGLKRKELPKLDDDFAKDMRDVPTMEELRKSLRAELEAAAAVNREGVVRGALVEQLIDKNPVDAPPALVDSAAGKMAEEFVERFERRGLRMPGGGELRERLKAGSLAQAGVEVKTFFLLDAIATAEKIEIGPDAIKEKFQQLADDDGVPVEKVMSHYRTPQALLSLREQIRNDRAYELVKKEATITERAVEPVATPVEPPPAG